RVSRVVRRRRQSGEVEEGAGRDREGVLALAAGLAVGTELETVERAGEDARGGRLAGSARSGEEICVAGAVFAHRVAQRDGDVILTHQLGEMLRAVLAVEAHRGHGFRWYRRGVRCPRPARAMSGP